MAATVEGRIRTTDSTVIGAYLKISLFQDGTEGTEVPIVDHTFLQLYIHNRWLQPFSQDYWGFWETYSWQFYLLFNVIARNLLRASRQRNIFIFSYCCLIWGFEKCPHAFSQNTICWIIKVQISSSDEHIFSWSYILLEVLLWTNSLGKWTLVSNLLIVNCLIWAFQLHFLP